MRGVTIALLGLAACTDPAPARREVLIFSKTLGYRHDDAIVAAAGPLTMQLAARDIGAELGEDEGRFTPEALAGFDGVVFLYTSGNDLLPVAGKAALEEFVRDGGGWVGLHSAADTEYAWPFYQALVVAPFADHPVIQPARVEVLDRTHPALVAAPEDPWIAEDEWYNFQRNPRATPGVEILATVDEASYIGGTMGADHPIVWAHANLGGRALYSGLGHVATRWEDPAFVAHVAAAIDWAARQR